MNSPLLRPVVVLVAAALPAASVVADVSVPAATPRDTADEAHAQCRSPESVAVRRAIDRWCRGSAPVRRRYYEWSLARTRRQACADLRRTPCVTVGDEDTDGDRGPVVVVDDSAPEAVATYWEVHLVRRGREFRVADLDFVEDCTGP
jgi:hypothetical protein